MTDLNRLYYDSRDNLRGEQVRTMIGHSARQRKETSPLQLADRIHIPVLLAHGSADRVVPVDYSRSMFDALEKIWA